MNCHSLHSIKHLSLPHKMVPALALKSAFLGVPCVTTVILKDYSYLSTTVE